MSKYILLIIIALLSIFSKNKIMLYATLTVLILALLPYHEKNLNIAKTMGIRIGLYVITVAILAPIALGMISFDQLGKTLVGYKGIIAIIAGIGTSILSTKGIQLQVINPQIVIALSIGTIVGLVVFKGTASGPIIASGATYAIFQLIDKFK